MDGNSRHRTDTRQSYREAGLGPGRVCRHRLDTVYYPAFRRQRKRSDRGLDGGLGGAAVRGPPRRPVPAVAGPRGSCHIGMHRSDMCQRDPLAVYRGQPCGRPGNRRDVLPALHPSAGRRNGTFGRHERRRCARAWLPVRHHPGTAQCAGHTGHRTAIQLSLRLAPLPCLPGHAADTTARESGRQGALQRHRS